MVEKQAYINTLIIFLVIILIFSILYFIKLKFDGYEKQKRQRARELKVYEEADNNLRPIQELAIAIGVKIESNMPTFEG